MGQGLKDCVYPSCLIWPFTLHDLPFMIANHFWPNHLIVVFVFFHRIEEQLTFMSAKVCDPDLGEGEDVQVWARIVICTCPTYS